MRTAILMCCALAAFGATGCDRSGDAAPFRISGDTLVSVKTIEVDGVPQAAECRAVFGAYVDDENAQARITGGRLVYTDDGGAEMARVAWSEADVPNVWPSSTITKAKPQASLPVGVGMSLPFRPLRGEAVFTYVLGDRTEPDTAAPFVFRCR